MRLRARIVVDERSPELEKINNYICTMYAKKKYKPMYGNGGAIKYQDGGPVKSDSTNVSLMDKLNSLRGSEGIDLFGMEAVLDAKRKRDAEMEGLSEVDKLRKSFGIPEGGAGPGSGGTPKTPLSGYHGLSPPFPRGAERPHAGLRHRCAQHRMGYGHHVPRDPGRLALLDGDP